VEGFEFTLPAGRLPSQVGENGKLNSMNRPTPMRKFRRRQLELSRVRVKSRPTHMCQLLTVTVRCSFLRLTVSCG